ncbi:alpha/beta hydrolase [Streptococcus sp. zg-JUN1979]|uniref:alpha/beta hydrolase n=1 Tax=Streptococcus sp. zg-JUN1979 TaxID=3391450 RepID=UPI0039A45A09
MRKIRKCRIIALIAGLIFLGTVLASFYFFHVAQVRGEKSFVGEGEVSKSSALYPYQEAFNQLTYETQTMENQGLKQEAWYVPAEKQTNKTVIVVHGFTSSKAYMKAYGYLFHKLGYNVLMPDNIAHGNSKGQLIGYGWNDRLNVLKWADILIRQNPSVEITLFGVSMGGATVMMASGEELPSQITTIIEDCGYTSVWDELAYQAKELYNLPAFPLLYEVSALSKIRAGFSYGEASSVKQLAKNKLPILFIHGEKDDFVPTEMVYDNYAATTAPKELYIAKGAGHAKSFESDPKTYEDKIALFLKKYEK